MPVCITKLEGTAFLAFPECKNLLTSELSRRFYYGKILSAATISGSAFASQNCQWFGDLLYCPDFCVDSRPETKSAKNGDLPYWASVALTEPFLLRFESIGEASRALKEIQRNWAPYQYQFFRRGALIQEKLPYINLKDKNFFKVDEKTGEKHFSLEIPKSPMGLYTLIDEKTIFAGAVTSSSIPAGLINFVEDHENPPSRAYLKIQESLTLAHHFFGAELPGKNSKCFEAGACPGGWTWVLRGLGADVFAVDRAELVPSLMEDSHVKFLAHDAFTLKPEEVCAELDCQKLDWVFSDVICYPERLLEWINLWLESGRTKNMICTIKMQGEIDWELVKKFADIPNSRVVHLHYNKHELTWMHVEK